MEVFNLRARLVTDYLSYASSYGSIPDYALTGFWLFLQHGAMPQ
jgi:hypothetical protein